MRSWRFGLSVFVNWLSRRDDEIVDCWSRGKVGQQQPGIDTSIMPIAETDIDGVTPDQLDLADPQIRVSGMVNAIYPAAAAGG